jgi:hypothetical protein
MFNFLKKTWRQDEDPPQSSISVPSAEDAESVLDQALNEDIPTWKPGSKRPREEFDPEPQPSSAERPSKAKKTGTNDSIRNHLPEIVDSRHRDDAIAPLSLSLLKEQISQIAKDQNSESSIYDKVVLFNSRKAIAVLPSTKRARQFIRAVSVPLTLYSSLFPSSS